MMLKNKFVLGLGMLLAAGSLWAQGSAPAAGQGNGASQATPPAQNSAAAPTGQQAQSSSQAQANPEAGSNSSTAAKPAPQHDLLDIYQLAVQNDPTIRKAEADYLAQTQQKPLARSRLLPTLQASASRSSSNSTNPNPPINFVTGEPQTDISETISESDSNQYSVSLSETIFDWSRYVQLKQADKVVAQAETTYEAAKQDLMVRVATAYFGVLAEQDTLAADIAAREALSQQLEQAQRRFQVGLIAITDVQEAQAAYDQAVAQVIAEQQRLATSEEQLREIIGERVSDLAGPTSELPLVTPNPADADAWVQQALKDNPTLIATRIAADITQDDITIARSARLPTLSLSTSYSNSSSDSTRTLHGVDVPPATHSVGGNYGYNWQLSVEVPIFNGGQIRATVQQRVYQHRSAVEQTEFIARQTERQTRDAYLGVLSSISSVRALLQAEKSAETALQATEAGFQVGTRTAVDVVTQQQQLSQAQTNYATARYNYIVNVLTLEQAAGSLTLDDMQKVNGWLSK